MDCLTCADDLTAYLDGELSKARTQEVKAHLDLCGACREEFRSLELSARFVETHAGELRVRPELWNSVRARISTLEVPASSQGLFRWLTANPWWSTAAAAMAMAALALGLWGYVSHEKAQKELLQYMTDYVQARDAQEQASRTLVSGPGQSTSQVGVSHSEYFDNPFVTVKANADMNPFRSEDQ
jgi:anti-sigma factor RsiW